MLSALATDGANIVAVTMCDYLTPFSYSAFNDWNI